MLSKRSRHPGRDSSNAAVMAAAPPPRITSFSRPPGPGTRALARGVPELDAGLEPEVVAEPGREERANRSGRQPEILADGLALEIAEIHDVLAEEAALVKVHDLHRRVGDGLIASAIGLGDVAELLEPDEREGPRDEVLERGEEHAPLVGDLVEGARQRVEKRPEAAGRRSRWRRHAPGLTERSCKPGGRL